MANNPHGLMMIDNIVIPRQFGGPVDRHLLKLTMDRRIRPATGKISRANRGSNREKRRVRNDGLRRERERGSKREKERDRER